jgi:hypothetical protein
MVPGNDWLTCVGRLTFPIYAFLLVEGYFHTRSLKKYVTRLGLTAILSEIPFNLAMGSSWFYPIHQNVLWSFLIALALILLNERVKTKARWLRGLVGASTVLLGCVRGLVTMVDFYHAGILTVLVFYFFRRPNADAPHARLWNGVCLLGQLVCLWYVNTELLGGYTYELSLFGYEFGLVRQGLALFALLPIWLYRGEQGYHPRWMRYLFYGFYPAHLLVLGLLKFIL